MPGKLPLFLIAAVLFLLQGAATAEAATLEGTVTTSDGRAVSGAMVTVFSANRMRKETVFTDADGLYLIVTSFDGELTVRARAPRFADETKKVTVAPNERLLFWCRFWISRNLKYY